MASDFAEKKLPKIGGRFATTKGAGRGLGLKRIDAVIERLGGYVSRGSEDGAFTTEVLLPQACNSSPENDNSSPE